jgi:hypothetical protein
MKTSLMKSKIAIATGLFFIGSLASIPANADDNEAYIKSTVVVNIIML